jgi:hypothetical protein
MTISELSKAFAELAQDHGDRMAHAAESNATLSSQIKAGERPVNYRVNWIRSTTLALNETLRAKCIEFDATYKKDKATSTDCVNVVMTLLNALLATVGKKVEVVDQNTFRIV